MDEVELLLLLVVAVAVHAGDAHRSGDHRAARSEHLVVVARIASSRAVVASVARPWALSSVLRGI